MINEERTQQVSETPSAVWSAVFATRSQNDSRCMHWKGGARVVANNFSGRGSTH
jgi:hypothetical protein